jgi:hypothetical protein
VNWLWWWAIGVGAVAALVLGAAFRASREIEEEGKDVLEGDDDAS